MTDLQAERNEVCRMKPDAFLLSDCHGTRPALRNPAPIQGPTRTNASLPIQAYAGYATSDQIPAVPTQGTDQRPNPVPTKGRTRRQTLVPRTQTAPTRTNPCSDSRDATRDNALVLTQEPKPRIPTLSTRANDQTTLFPSRNTRPDQPCSQPGHALRTNPVPITGLTTQTNPCSHQVTPTRHPTPAPISEPVQIHPSVPTQDTPGPTSVPNPVHRPGHNPLPTRHRTRNQAHVPPPRGKSRPGPTLFPPRNRPGPTLFPPHGHRPRHQTLVPTLGNPTKDQPCSHPGTRTRQHNRS
nr:pollen-specific leucine-rich repeat extensin-like protein 1 [Salvelinus alpinus]